MTINEYDTIKKGDTLRETFFKWNHKVISVNKNAHIVAGREKETITLRSHNGVHYEVKRVDIIEEWLKVEK